MKTLFLGLALVFAAACGDDGNVASIDAPPGNPDAGTDGASGPDASCFENPTTHTEIINACTDAQKIYATRPAPPLTLPDGGLPALPPP